MCIIVNAHPDRSLLEEKWFVVAYVMIYAESGTFVARQGATVAIGPPRVWPPQPACASSDSELASGECGTGVSFIQRLRISFEPLLDGLHRGGPNAVNRGQVFHLVQLPVGVDTCVVELGVRREVAG